MSTTRVLFYVESRYKINRKHVKNTVASVLAKQNVTSPIEVSIAVIGDRKMRALSKKYKGEDKTRNILSFSLAEGEPVHTPLTNLERLGDIVISYPVVIQESARDEMLVDDKVDELVEHGMLHLLGLHHE